MTSAEQFFTYGVLKSRPDNDITDGLGLPDPTLLGALAVTWIILYFSLRGGVGGQGKVVETINGDIVNNLFTHKQVAYFTAIFPYLVLLTLLVRGLTLPGFEKGSFGLKLRSRSVFFLASNSETLSKVLLSSSHQNGRS